MSCCGIYRAIKPKQGAKMNKKMLFHPRRSEYHVVSPRPSDAADKDIALFETYDTIYRSLCAALYNYAPGSGHPGGSISSGRFVSAILYDRLDYDFSQPDREDADIISYAAGHKALGLYAHLALRNEIVRIGAPGMLPDDIGQQLRLEDLLGFRRNPITRTPLFLRFQSKALDGHPTPATPFVRLSTGASGVGLASSIGLAFGAADYYGASAPVVHIVEGEGGLTPGRVAEALAAAGTASLKNVVLHIDWNQSSIDSNFVCGEGSTPGDYVQWDPMELAYLHDWNVILVEDGKDLPSIFAAQQKASSIGNSQPTAIVYKTVKGWQYGIEGKGSHGAGHALCSAEFYKSVKPLLDLTGKQLEMCKDEQLCKGGTESAIVEKCFWDALLIVRETFETKKELTTALAARVIAAQERLNKLCRERRNGAPTVSRVYALASLSKEEPASLTLSPGSTTTLRGQLGKVLQFYNKASGGAFLTSAADLLGSTSVNIIGTDFDKGYYNADTNRFARTLSIGGICEDAMSGVASGISTFGHHIGVCSSYGAFIAPLGHIAARLHAIGVEARHTRTGRSYDPFFMISAHAGIKTGEDGPTHADPQPLQILQENFPRGTMITVTPWDPQEMWPLVSEALKHRPAIISPFVTRPTEKIVDRSALGLAPADASRKGVYLLREATTEKPDGVVILQGSEVAYEFVTKALPMIFDANLDIAAYYFASSELFYLLHDEEKEEIFPERVGQTAMGISGFTLPTMYRWVQSHYGRQHTLYPFRKGHFLGSGKAESVIAEAGLDGLSQFEAIRSFVLGRKVSKVAAKPVRAAVALN
jgi:transketolase